MFELVLLWVLSALAGIALIALGTAALTGTLSALGKLVFVEARSQACLDA